METRSAVLLLALSSALTCSCSSLSKLVSTEPTQERNFSTPDSTGIILVDCQAIFDPGDVLDLLHPGKLILDVASEEIFGPDEADLKRGTLLGSDGRAIAGLPTEEYGNRILLFPDLPSGTYRLSELVAEYNLSAEEEKEFYENWPTPDALEFIFTFPSEDNPDFTFGVDAGDCIYLGRLTVTADRAPPYKECRTETIEHKDILGLTTVESSKYEFRKFKVGGDYKIDSRKKHEIEALNRLIHNFHDSPWAERWRVRVAALKDAE